MVCPRCIKVVKEDLERLGFKVTEIELGEVVLDRSPGDNDMERIKRILEEEGFELIEDYKGKLIDSVKNVIIDLIQNYDETELEDIVFSAYLSRELDKDYNYLSSLFSKTEGITIEHYVILQKIEKAKELLKYGELTLSEIAYKLGYSSVQHLSRQFKQVTGLTATEFRTNLRNLRKPIDNLN
jgi:AraC-like DNA-binding protein